MTQAIEPLIIAGTRMTGQACVSAITQIEISRICDIMRHSSQASTRDMITALEHLGYQACKRCKQINIGQYAKIPDECVMRITYTPKRWDWYARIDGQVYDATRGTIRRGSMDEQEIIRRVTSYLWYRRPEE